MTLKINELDHHRLKIVVKFRSPGQGQNIPEQVHQSVKDLHISISTPHLGCRLILLQESPASEFVLRVHQNLPAILGSGCIQDGLDTLHDLWESDDKMNGSD